jgi:cytochrome c553
MAQTLGKALVERLALMARFAVPMMLVTLATTPAGAAETPATQYVNTIAILHARGGGPAIGRIMPATPVIVHATKGAHVKVEVTGWSPMGGARYLFKDVGLRIRWAVLTEQGVAKRTVVGKKDDKWESTWEQARVTGWIDRKDIVPDIDTIWEEASKLYFSRCSRCHSLRRPREFTANQWPSVLKIMTVRAGFSPVQAATVTALLQNHGRNQKGEDFFSKRAATVKAAPAPAAVPKIEGSSKLAAEGAALFESVGCGACHGEDGNAPIMPEYPKLGGQNAGYLYKQVLDFKTGKRTNDAFSAMKEAVANVSDKDAKALAYWLSTR